MRGPGIWKEIDLREPSPDLDREHLWRKEGKRSREEMRQKKKYLLVFQKCFTQNKISRIYKICSQAASKPEIKIDRACQAEC